MQDVLVGGWRQCQMSCSPGAELSEGTLGRVTCSWGSMARHWAGVSGVARAAASVTGRLATWVGSFTRLGLQQPGPGVLEGLCLCQCSS